MKYWKGSNIKILDGITLHGICKARPLYTKAGRRSISEALIFGISCFKLLFVRFDVIDCCGFPYFSLFPLKIATTLRRKKLYSSWHEVWGKEYWKEYLGTLGFVGFWVEKIASRTPDHIIATSNHTADLLRSHLGINNCTIIVNGVNTAAIENAKVAKAKTDIIYAGRLMEFKNIHLIIEALAILKKRDKNLKCTIIGQGPARDNLQTLAKKLKVSRQIIWIDFFESSEDVYSHMKAAKVFVLPSSREGFGIVIIEANAAGKPALSADFNSNGSRGLIKEGINGFIFKPNKIDLASKIDKVLTERNLLESSSKEFAKNFDWDRLSVELVRAYAI